MDLDLKLSNVELAKRFGVTEGTIRYHKRKKLLNKEDGRKTRYSGVSRFSSPIEDWVQINLADQNKKRKTIQSLYRTLQTFHNYDLSYDALRRYIRKYFPKIMEKTWYLRVETPPGALAQVDWKEDVKVQLEVPENWATVNFLILLLCFSRKPAVCVRLKKDQPSFLSAHYQAVKALGGAPKYIRCDCMKTAVSLWRGQCSQMNNDYQDFLNRIGSSAFPARPGKATDKGKVEKKIRDIFRDVDFRRIVFRDLDHLQDFINQKIDELCSRTICPATGTTVAKAFEYEKKYLNQTVEKISEIPEEAVSAIVQKGSLVWYRGNHYQIPEGFIGKKVRCVNTGTTLKIFHQGQLLETFRIIGDAKGMVRMSKASAETSQRPMSDLVRSWWLEVADRQIDYYQEITGGVR